MAGQGLLYLQVKQVFDFIYNAAAEAETMKTYGNWNLTARILQARQVLQRVPPA